MNAEGNKIKITQKEQEILQILLDAEKPLVVSEIKTLDDTLSINTIQSVLKKLMSKKLIKIADIVYSGTVLARSYCPTDKAKDYIVAELENQIEKVKHHVGRSGIIAALLGTEHNNEEEILELEKILMERKKKLKKEK